MAEDVIWVDLRPTTCRCRPIKRLAAFYRNCYQNDMQIELRIEFRWRRWLLPGRLIADERWSENASASVQQLEKTCEPHQEGEKLVNGGGTASNFKGNVEAGPCATIVYCGGLRE
ncbi:unnamed protein product [Caenorhabditis auriculariae]|uniref:Uncharacterized protein n=1 Tax=Caenorhabditis auriculariae TaxID=2777116 RepID=A0A8S1HFV3_9PELO|nr:unnamed protein product [Caenorhabditis auriculariae]